MYIFLHLLQYISRLGKISLKSAIPPWKCLDEAILGLLLFGLPKLPLVFRVSNTIVSSFHYVLESCR